MLKLIVTLEESLYGNYLVTFADSNTDRIICFAHCDLDLKRRDLKIYNCIHEVMPIYQPNYSDTL